MLLAEELLLLCLDEDSGEVVSPPGGPELSPEVLATALAEALLVDLRARQLIAVTQSGELAASGEGSGDGLLDVARETVVGLTPPDAVTELAAQPVHRAVALRLADQGVLHPDEDESGRFPERAADTERGIRQRLRGTLLDGAAPRVGDVALIALLDHVGLLPVVAPDADPAALAARAAQITQEWRRAGGLSGAGAAAASGAVTLSTADGAVSVDAGTGPDAVERERPSEPEERARAARRRAEARDGAWDNLTDVAILASEAPTAARSIGAVFSLGGDLLSGGVGAVRGLFSGLDLIDLFTP